MCRDTNCTTCQEGARDLVEGFEEEGQKGLPLESVVQDISFHDLNGWPCVVVSLLAFERLLGRSETSWSASRLTSDGRSRRWSSSTSRSLTSRT